MNHGPRKTMKVGATAPALQVQFIHKSSQTPIDLTNHTVTFLMFVVNDDSSTTVTAVGTATITDAVNGFAQYDWEAGDTALANIHYGIFQIDYSGGSIEKFPNHGFIEIEIEAS